MHLAILTKQPRVARCLVAAGARVDMRDRQGNCPIHIAAQQGDLDSVQALSMALSATELQQCQLRYQPFAQTLPQQLDASNYDGKFIFNSHMQDLKKKYFIHLYSLYFTHIHTHSLSLSEYDYQLYTYSEMKL